MKSEYVVSSPGDRLQEFNISVQTIKISKIIVNQKYKKIVPEPNTGDYSSLYESIKVNGIAIPLVLNEKHVLLDGHTRYKIARELGRTEVPIIIKKFNDPLVEAMFVIDANISRRNLTEGQKAKLVMGYLDIEEKLAARRRSAGKKDAENEKGRAASKVGEKFDMSPRQIDRVRKIMREGSDGVKKQYESGKITTNAAYQIVQRETRVISNKPLPIGKHNVLYIDFPWKYENQKTGGSMTSGASQKYDTLTPEEIIDEFIGRSLYVCDFCGNTVERRAIDLMRAKVKNKHGKQTSCSFCKHEMKLLKTVPKKNIIDIAAKDAVIFMWMTVPMLEDQWSVIRAFGDHGFKFKQCVFWIKTGHKGIGFWFENQVEVLVMLVRGKVEAFRSSVPNFMILPPGKHSEKPEDFRNLIDRVTASMGVRNKVELFARSEPSKGWKKWGNEV